MENPELKNPEKIECNKDFILKNLKLTTDPEAENFLKLESDLAIDDITVKRFEKPPLDSPKELFRYFEGIGTIEPDRICRPKGDTTLFTSAGVQHIETIFREKGDLKKEQFAVTQPVIRSQFMDKIKDGVSTSFVNFSVESIDSNPQEFTGLSDKFIKLVVDQGIDPKELKFQIEDVADKWGDKKFNKTVLTLYFKDIELGECVYIHDYPVKENEKVSISDIGMGVERLNWAVGKSKYYLPDYEKFYVMNESKQDRNKITSVIDCIRSMVLIVGDGVKPSNHDYGYRIRQFSKRFVSRSQGVIVDVPELIHLSYGNWEKWGYKFRTSEEEIAKTIQLENDRNFNGFFLSKLREVEKVDIYIDINQDTSSFLKQANFSLSKELIDKIIKTLK